MKLVYTAKETWVLLGICRSTLFNWIEAGKIRKVPNLGVKILITHSELERFLGITNQEEVK